MRNARPPVSDAARAVSNAARSGPAVAKVHAKSGPALLLHRGKELGKQFHPSSSAMLDFVAAEADQITAAAACGRDNELEGPVADDNEALIRIDSSNDARQLGPQVFAGWWRLKEAEADRKDGGIAGSGDEKARAVQQAGGAGAKKSAQ